MSAVRPSWERSNRGRNRATAVSIGYEGNCSKRRTKFVRPSYRWEKAVGKVLKKGERRQARKEIDVELALIQLEREFMTNVFRGQRKHLQKLALMAGLFDELTLDEMLYDAREMKELHEDMMALLDRERDYDDDYDGVRDLRDGGRYSHSYDDDDIYDDDPFLDRYNDWNSEPELDPKDSLWVDAWLRGEVGDGDFCDWHKQSGCMCHRDAYDYDEEYCQACGELFEHCDCDVNPLAPMWRLPEDYRIHSDDDRNNERLRAGERYYKQNHRTVYNVRSV